ncbi:MAG: FtsX-like permease family protein [Planctomycetia bacterium]|nr:FtsX-like permease family protein [Planctomycetia bacterium]
MKTLLKLTLREMVYYRSRLILAILAIILPCCMIVWYIGSFDILQNVARNDIKNYFGDYHVVITQNKGNFPENFITELRADKNVRRLDRGFQTSCNAARGVTETSGLDKLRKTTGTPQRNPVVTGVEVIMTSENRYAPYEVEDGRWLQASDSPDAELECVLSQSARNMLQSYWQEKLPDGSEMPEEIQLGETVDVNTVGGNFRLKVVGFLKQGIQASGFSTNVSTPGGSRMPPAQETQNTQTKQNAASGVSPTPSAEGNSTAPAAVTGESSVASSAGSTATPVAQNTPPSSMRGSSVNLTSPAMYVPLETARKIGGNPEGCNMLFLQLQDISVKDFRQTWEKKCKLADMVVQFSDADSLQEMMSARDSSSMILNQARGVIGLVLLTAIFIIFTTLSMGVSERTRQLAILRTIGFTKGQIRGFITMEGLFLGVLGWLGGLLAGWAMLVVITMMNPGLSAKDVVISPLTILIALLCSLLGAFLASLLPAWRATRIAPLDALFQERKLASQKGTYLSAFIGASVLVTLWLLVFVVPMEDSVRAIIASTGGSVIAAIAILLMAPLMVIIVEKIFSPILACILGINSAFLQKELSSNKWRTLGTTVSFSVGLGLYTMIQVWGYSMLGPFMPSKNLPDTLASFLPAGIPHTEVENVMNIPGIIQEDFMPLAIAQPRLADEHMEGRTDRMGAQMNNVVLFGVDPQIAFRKDNPTVNLTYLDGNRHETLRMMCDYPQRACLIPDMMAKRFHLKVGDKLKLKTPTDSGGGRGGFMGGQRPSMSQAGLPAGNMPSGELLSSRTPAEGEGKLTDGTHTPPPGGNLGGRGGGPDGAGFSASEGRPGAGFGGGGMFGRGGPGGGSGFVEYKIVGIVQIPGWHWITKTSGVRTESGRTGGMVFAAYDNVRNDFNLSRYGFFWMNTKPGTTHAFLESEMQKIAARSGGVSSLNPNENVHLAQSARGVTQGFVKVNTYDTFTQSITGRANSVIQQMARMPLIILFITTFAVMNTMIASVRTRRWEMGILRAYGVTRGGLVRLIFAEAILIGICTCVLSLIFGTFTGACAVTGSSGFGGFLGGVIPPVVIPWARLSFGFGAALFLCLIAAILPAVKIGREEPASLLVRKG